MSDISSDRIRDLLSDPKNIELIAGIAGTMGATGLLGALSEKPDKENSVPTMAAHDVIGEKNEAYESRQEAALTVSEKDAISPLPPLAFGGGSALPDKRIALLKAIKPYISDAKKERVDGLVRAISVAGILNNYKGGLFG